MSAGMPVFVYGTLKEGGWNHRWMGSSPCLGVAETVEWYTLYQDEHEVPHLWREEHSYPVRGELYLVDYATMLDLDELEGHPLVYYREQVLVRGAQHNELLAWVYFAREPHGRRLERGFYLID